MSFIIYALIIIATFAVSVFGFCQIIGSLRTIHIRGVSSSLITIVIWGAILFAFGSLIMYKFYAYRYAYYIVSGIALFMSWNTGKNGLE